MDKEELDNLIKEYPKEKYSYNTYGILPPIPELLHIVNEEVDFKEYLHYSEENSAYPSFFQRLNNDRLKIFSRRDVYRINSNINIIDILKKI